MAKFNLVTIRPKGFLHASAFQEVKDSLGWALASLNHQTMSTENAFTATPDATNVIFGAELLSQDSEIPPNSVIFNLEQPSHPSMENVRRMAAGKQVWDYSASNVADWQARSVEAHHLPIGYTPNLTRIPKAATQDIDVFFAGWLTPRRSKLIQQLTQAGLKVVATDSCYGGGRDQLISRAKICLNVNHDGRNLFNIVRVSFLLANSKCVISELAQDTEVYAQDLDGALEWHRYEDLLAACLVYLRSDSDRQEREQQAFQAIQKMDFIASVRSLLVGNGTHTHPILERYREGCQDGDMKDFLPTLRSLAKGQILEIGIRDGASTSAFLLGLEEKGGHLTSVDIQDCSGLWTHPQWRVICQDSKACVFPDSSFDMALIDGDHSEASFQQDLENSLRWVRPGGLILCHDITPLPNFTNEVKGGDWPSQYVGEQFFKAVREKKLRYFIYPGTWGLGVIVKDPQ
jgi:predicted O-methyltransferase YrrM